MIKRKKKFNFTSTVWTILIRVSRARPVIRSSYSIIEVYTRLTVHWIVKRSRISGHHNFFDDKCIFGSIVIIDNCLPWPWIYSKYFQNKTIMHKNILHTFRDTLRRIKLESLNPVTNYKNVNTAQVYSDRKRQQSLLRKRYVRTTAREQIHLILMWRY